MEAISCGYGASTLYDNVILWKATSRVHLNFQIWASDGNSMMEVQSPHPQRMNDDKHLVYAQGRCGGHSMWVWSLKCCMIVSFCESNNLEIRPANVQIKPIMSDGNSMMEVPSAYPQHTNDVIHLVYAQGRCGGHSMWVWSSTAV